MKKKAIIFFSIFFILICLFLIIKKFDGYHEKKYTVDIQLDTNQFDLSVVDCIPQKLIDITDFGTVSRLTIRCKNSFDDFSKTKFSKNNKDIEKYLQETEYIDFYNSVVIDLSRKLNLSELSPMDCAKAVLQNINQSTGFIEYDSQLALQISSGITYGYPASEVLKKSKGTCGEFANVFVALMRLNNIPCKYIQGYMITPNGQSIHAWAEFYDENIGWIPVDPQVGMFGVSPYHVKMLEGVDFSKTGADFSSLMFGNAKIINN
ncbi:MAG: transglutaminase domain-containing protein [Treponema sp.]|nr:transglutaminase domain-containing protein [Treponema sp.]